MKSSRTMITCILLLFMMAACETRKHSQLAQETNKSPAEEFVRQHTFIVIGELKEGRLDKSSLEFGSPSDFTQSWATIYKDYDLRRAKIQIKFTGPESFEITGNDIVKQEGKVHKLNEAYAYVTLKASNGLGRTHVYTVNGEMIELPQKPVPVNEDPKLFKKLLSQLADKRYVYRHNNDDVSIEFHQKQTDDFVPYKYITARFGGKVDDNFLSGIWGFVDFARDQEKENKIILRHFDGVSFSGSGINRRNTARLKSIYDVKLDRQQNIIEIIPRKWPNIIMKLENTSSSSN